MNQSILIFHDHEHPGLFDEGQQRGERKREGNETKIALKGAQKCLFPRKQEGNKSEIKIPDPKICLL